MDDDRGVVPLSQLYRDTRHRLADLITGLDDADLDRAVPACPGWAVRDVLAHLVAIPEDAAAGRLAGVPSEEQTAAQVARWRGRPVTELLDAWASTAPAFEAVVEARTIWPAVIDVATHEQDVRGALGRPGGRDADVVRIAARVLLAGLDVPVPLVVAVDGDEVRRGPDPVDGGGPEVTPLRLTTDSFEVLRWRMGRRSRAQLTAMDWTGDPAPVLDRLVVFGPAEGDLVE